MSEIEKVIPEWNQLTESERVTIRTIIKGYLNHCYIIPRTDPPEKWVEQYEAINKHGLRGVQLKWKGK